MNTRRLALSVVTAAALVSLSACTDGGIATTTPSPTLASPTATASPTPSASLGPLTDAELLALMPPEAAVDDVRGAIATAKFFLEQFPLVYETGDLRMWDALSMPDCTFCDSVRSDVIEEQAVGDYETGGTATYDEQTIVANYYPKDGYTYVTFDYVQDPSMRHHADGTSEASGDGGTGSISLRMTFVDRVWRVSDVGVEED